MAGLALASAESRLRGAAQEGDGWSLLTTFEFAWLARKEVPRAAAVTADGSLQPRRAPKSLSA
eukprot:CAMPEP_0181447846 /NCGR_PEP_ID=MMETSP1110-20121109/26834_1 /TAXON_ID=174948 /ORGANISM="Symbiodinium sp., Strain CCMP421" /LENGTH=62 /DNA_ID=CAMNT_0023571975 /DNA_START=59 /DNA_END=244 /DNA_ORIENTATION=+